MPFSSDRILGAGVNVTDVLVSHPGRKMATVRNLGPAPAWLGNRDLADPTFGKGLRILPGELLSFTSAEPIYAITWANNTYTLETWDE